MYAIHTFEQWQVIGFNKQGEQHNICRAHSLDQLLKEFTKELEKAEKSPLHREVLNSYAKIKVWNVEHGFTSLELPSIPN